jgi:Fic family protein
MDAPVASNRPWQPITPLDSSTVLSEGRIAALEALRAAWKRELEAVPEAERVRRRQRTLRRLAVETGIIEGLYDLDWGLTLTLVAEGFARDVVERAGGSGRVGEETLATLNAQRESLEMVIDFVRNDRTLTASFIKELHHAITRTQSHYDATDSLGHVVRRELIHGAWKQWPNHVQRQDGSLLEYCPPEHVASEVDNLATWYEALEATDAHPLVKAAWLHHRFVQIHPFADGNGRVARALTVLVLQRHRFAPLVVDRHHRGDYLKALDRANDGDLSVLVSLFINLESSALAGELEETATVAADSSRHVAKTLAAQLADRRARAKTARAIALQVRVTAVFAIMRQWMESKRDELRAVFTGQGIVDARVDFFEARSDQPSSASGPSSGLMRHMYFRRQIIDAAHAAGHYAYFGGFVGLLTLRVKVEGLALSFVASLHGAGADTGVMAITTIASARPVEPGPGDEGAIDVPTTSDAFYFAYEETIESLNEREAELTDLLDAGLTVALADLTRRV